jgi:hypothetical protein
VLVSPGGSAPGRLEGWDATGGAVQAPAAYDGALIVHRSLEELASRADRIVVVDVRGVHARPEDGGVVTDLQLDVRATLKGTPARTLGLTLPGGDLGSRGQWAGGVPRFVVGERALLLLREQPTLHLDNLWQGKYTLLGDQAVQPEADQSQSIASLQARISQAIRQPVEVGEGSQLVVPAFSTDPDCDWPQSALPVGHFVNPANPGNGAPTGSAFVRLMYESLHAWQALPDSYVSLRIAGTTSRNSPSNDGNNDIAWRNLGGLGTDLVGINYCNWQSINGGPRNRVDSDTYFNNNAVKLWTTTGQASRVDLRGIAQHELGHGIGLLHTNVACDTTPNTPLMCPTTSSGPPKTIKPDDQAGAKNRYPLSGSPPSAPSGLSGSTSGNAIELNWTDNASNEHAFELQRSSSACSSASFKAVATIPRSQTSFLDNDYGANLPDGTYCYRVKALGQGGDSGFSNTAQVAIGAPEADLRGIFASSTPEPVTIGQPLTLKLQVRNFGPDRAFDVVMTYTIPPIISPSSVVTIKSNKNDPQNPGQCQRNFREVTCTIHSLATAVPPDNGGLWKITLKLTPTATGQFESTVLVTGSRPDPNPNNNDGTRTTTVNGP